jgi:rubredoxin
VRETSWRTDEPCPVCGTGLVLVDTGRPVLKAECRLCGYIASWDPQDRTPDGDW